jgi:RHS repeat-associated protein
VSKLAVGLESSIVDPFEFTVEYDGEYNELATELRDYLDNSLSCAEIGPENVGRNFDLEVIQQNHVTPASEVENDIYFYHTDHLGSSSWITYTDGSVTQHMQNLPFGEPFIDQRATSYDIRYKFTGKEMDSETGYQYFGARYYNSDISVWLSVDPASELYPNESSYCFAGLNPIMITDPNGMWKDEGDGNWTAEKGDSWWKLHKQSGMSWEETMDYAKKYNADKGRDNWKSVRVGDQVSIPGSEVESSSTGEATGPTPSKTIKTPSKNQDSPILNLEFNVKIGVGGESKYKFFGVGVSQKSNITHNLMNFTINSNTWSPKVSYFESTNIGLEFGKEFYHAGINRNVNSSKNIYFGQLGPFVFDNDRLLHYNILDIGYFNNGVGFDLKVDVNLSPLLKAYRNLHTNSNSNFQYRTIYR